MTNSTRIRQNTFCINLFWVRWFLVVDWLVYCRTLPSKHLWTCHQGMTRIISCAALLNDRRDLSWDALSNRGAMQVMPIVFRCFHCQDENGRFPRIPVRAIPVRYRSWIGLGHPDTVHMALLMSTSTLTCGVLLQTVTRNQAAEKTRAWVEFVMF